MPSADPQDLDPARIQRVAAGVGRVVDLATATALARFGGLFLQWNARINLGGRLTPQSFVDRHLLDAFAACRYLAAGMRVVDVGLGGGLPAVPLAVLAPGCSFELYEPTAKKVAFLRTAVRALDIASRVHVHAARIEVPVDAGLAGTFDIATSRATFAPADWLPLGRQLVKPGGRVLVFATNEGANLPSPGEELAYAPDRRVLVF